LEAIVRSVEKNTRDTNDIKPRKSRCEGEIQALRQNIEDLRGQLKAFEHAWAIRRPFMRQPDAIHADIRNADSKLAQTAAEVVRLDAQIAAIQRGAPDLERAMIAGQAALTRVDRRAAEKEVSLLTPRKCRSTKKSQESMPSSLTSKSRLSSRLALSGPRSLACT